MAGQSLIETGADKLVTLVRKKKKISVPEAAKQLGVSPVVVEEWADFLEEEGIISMKYKFTTPYLTERVMSKDELARKEKEFGGKKEAFVRRAEATLALLDKESISFQQIKEQFYDMRKDLASEVEQVKGDLKELEKYEELKNNIEMQIRQQQNEFRQKVEEIERQITREENRYADIVKEIGQEEKKLDKERTMALTIRDEERLLRKRLDDFRKLIEKLEENINSEDKLIDDSEEHLGRLKELADEIRENVELRKNTMENLFTESRKQEKMILDTQDSILAKATKKKKEIEQRISQGKGASKKFKQFFNNRSKVDQLMNKINTERDELEKELIHLINKAKAFSIASKSKDVSSHMNEMKGTFKQIEKKKGSFEKELRKLVGVLRS